MIPEIAIIGHPNEGKSSVLSTLAEDDSVTVSPIPGETTRCRTFPVFIDGTEVLRFTDTPGFQNPQRILAELRTFNGNSETRLQKLHAFTSGSDEFRDDHELMLPIIKGAGIIYVVDGSRPIRNVDRNEMEILRLIGKPRMAIINCKKEEHRFLEDWKDEFRIHFNSSRIFNAHRATYAERIELLEALKAIDQDWQRLLTEIIDAFKKDWESRTRTTAAIISSLVSKSLSLAYSTDINEETEIAGLEQQLLEKYSNKVHALETSAHQQIKALFKHNIFNYELSNHSILKEDLFSKRTWEMLGLTYRQMALLGGISGAAVGASIDVAALGHGLGLFTALGTLTGVVGALAGRDVMKARASIMGIRVAGPKLQIGPVQNIGLLFILINRSLLFYRHTINWAHGRRDYPEKKSHDPNSDRIGFTRNWSSEYLKICNSFFKTVTEKDSNKRYEQDKALQDILFSSLMEISRADERDETWQRD